MPRVSPPVALVPAPTARTARGAVWLVGAGPGDPDLLTLRALDRLRAADVVVHDRLVSADVLALARPEAERIYVGKARGRHCVPQDGINALLVALARAGQRVVRLKGGDPFLFGRGGEEIAMLAEAGIPFEVVPGITAAAGCAAYAGIPLTHRDHAQSCVFVTGHLENGRTNLDWRSLARPRQTVVIYMGLTGLEEICGELARHGLDASTPAAIIEQGTTRAQRVICATLGDLPARAREAAVTSPALVIVGGVVTLRARLDWFSPGRDCGRDSGRTRREGTEAAA